LATVESCRKGQKDAEDIFEKGGGLTLDSAVHLEPPGDALELEGERFCHRGLEVGSLQILDAYSCGQANTSNLVSHEREFSGKN